MINQRKFICKISILVTYDRYMPTAEIIIYNMMNIQNMKSSQSDLFYTTNCNIWKHENSFLVCLPCFPFLIADYEGSGGGEPETPGTYWRIAVSLLRFCVSPLAYILCVLISIQCAITYLWRFESGKKCGLFF